MQPRQERMGRMEPLPAPVALVADDADRSWLLGGTGAPGRHRDRPGRAPSHCCCGGARRRRRPRLTVDGDAAALDDALGRRLTP